MEDQKPEALVWDYLDGAIAEDGVSALVEWLQGNPDNVKIYLKKVAIHRQLNDILCEGAVAEDLLLQLEKASESCGVPGADALGLSEPLELSASRRNSARFFHHPLLVGGLAASLVTFVFFISGMLRSPWDGDSFLASGNGSTGLESSEQETGTARDDVETFAAATVTGVLDARWGDEAESASYGEPLLEGRKLSLKEGLVQLTFESGVKLLVQGPTDFCVQSEMRGMLDTGKITAVVPSRAHGFTVRTPTAEIIDLGTEFALQVDELGGSEVHVFDGEVIAQALGRDGELVGDLVHVTEEKAVRYTSDSPTVSTINYNAKKFRRELEPRLIDSELPAIPVRDDLVLWLAADQLVKRDESDRVVAWRDILTGDNQTAEDAIQHIPEIRPLWVEEGINQRPALRFDGKSHLITTPLETTNDQTVALVFSVNHKAIHRSGNGGQILSYNGPPQRKIWNITQPGVLQIGDFNARKRGQFSAFVYSVNNGKGIQSGDASKLQMKPDTPVVMTYVYDRTNKRAKLFVDGKIKGTATASSLPAITSRKVIGRHGAHPEYFIGDLAELVIYNSALSEKKCDSLNQYLMDRYQIAVEEDNRM